MSFVSAEGQCQLSLVIPYLHIYMYIHIYISIHLYTCIYVRICTSIYHLLRVPREGRRLHVPKRLGLVRRINRHRLQEGPELLLEHHFLRDLVDAHRHTRARAHTHTHAQTRTHKHTRYHALLAYCPLPLALNPAALEGSRTGGVPIASRHSSSNQRTRASCDTLGHSHAPSSPSSPAVAFASAPASASALLAAAGAAPACHRNHQPWW